MLYSFADYVLDMNHRLLRNKDGEEIKLEPLQLLTLHYLIEHRDSVVSKKVLSEQVWESPYVSDHSIENCINGLRKALNDDRKNPQFIETRPRFGYRFIYSKVIQSLNTHTNGSVFSDGDANHNGIGMNAEILHNSSPSIMEGIIKPNSEIDNAVKSEDMVSDDKDHIATGVEKIEIELTIEGNYDDYGKAEIEKLLLGISKMIGVYGLEITRIRRGSVKITLELPADKAEELLWAVKEGLLADHGIVNAELKDNNEINEINEPSIPTDVILEDVGFLVNREERESKVVGIPGNSSHVLHITGSHFNRFIATKSGSQIVTIDDLVSAIEQYHPKADLIRQADFDLIRRAYAFVAEAHKEQKRRSGIPYIFHPLAVAYILTQLKMDAMTIASALLHDTIEVTGVTVQQVTELFGNDVAVLVEGVTKLSKLEFASREERQAESFRKTVVAMAKDIRVLLVKLADRLHTLRTLEHMPEEKQRSIAQETLDIYAPLAHRLGIAWVQSELEDLSFRYVNPQAYYEIEAQLASTPEARIRYLARMQEIIARELEQIHIPCTIAGQLKHLYSIYQKMLLQQLAFEDIHDILTVRVITDTVRNCYAALGMLHALWKPIPGRFKDYIALPKPNMYQSLHTTVVGPDGERVELQIRTEEMHRIAEEGIAAHWRYKEQTPSEKQDERFAWLRRLLEWQQDVQDPIEFMGTVKIDMFQEEVYVFTPRGEVRTFPRGATPVDFAYMVHTDIGHQCVGAKVNGRVVPLRYHLRNGDTVEILTSPTHVPSRDWLRWVVTPRARTKIKTWLKAEHKARSLALGREVCEREAQKYVPNPHVYLKPSALTSVAPHFGFQTADDLMVAVGYGRVSALQVVHRLLPPEIIEERKQKSKPSTPVVRKPRHDGIKVQGLNDILVNFARCCHPLPGDSIVGYITRGRRVTVHTTECLNVDKLEYDPERRVEVEWDVQQEATHPARITVVVHDQQGVMAGVSSAIAACNGNIRRVNVTTTQDNKRYLEFTVDVRDITHLNEITHRVKNLRGVLSVERVKNTPL